MALKFCLVCEIMEDITGHVTFIVIPTVSHEKSVENESFNVRTLYDYNPDADEYIPCKELGLFFKKGEILKIHRWVKIFGSKFLLFSLMSSVIILYLGVKTKIGGKHTKKAKMIWGKNLRLVLSAQKILWNHKNS